jgi:hypothetical protein
MTWWDNAGFSLLYHGDRYERLWWPLLEKEFPEYERFWLRHIVPLTNRINLQVGHSDSKWIAFRDDPNVNPDLEKMAMAHYSVFYYLARATLLVCYEPRLYVEDAFWLLGTTIYNLERFLKKWHRGLARAFGLCVSLLPPDDLEGSPFEEIRKYRHTLTHAPVLGRAHYPNSELLPGKEHLKEVEESWRFAQGLDTKSFIEARTLLLELRTELLGKLRNAWDEIEKALAPVRSKKEYRNSYGLDESFCIPGKGNPPLEPGSPTPDLSSPAASGFTVGSAVTHAQQVQVVSPSSGQKPQKG